MSRVLANFSCGAASAMATKIAIDKYGDRVEVVNAYIADEDKDNRRFLADCERWFGKKMTVLRDEKYGASPAQVWRKERYIVGPNGAPCSKHLKRDILKTYERSDDLIVLGYTADKRDAARLDGYIDANPTRKVWAPLIDRKLTKDDCFRMVMKAGIELPRMYRLGYPNANCPGCPKGGEGYWNHVRIVHPEKFAAMAELQELLGPGSWFFRNRKTKERISLNMLDPDAGRFEPITLPDCGAVCEVET